VIKTRCTDRPDDGVSFGWDDVNVAQQRPEVEAVAKKLMDLYGEIDVYEDDRDLYSDATALVQAHDDAIDTHLPAL
jgi:hypothetical protein